MSVYDDYPECLIRYAWLVEGTGLFTSGAVARCKACGRPVPGSEQKAHRRLEQRELAKLRKRRANDAAKENARRLRELNALRAETRREEYA